MKKQKGITLVALIITIIVMVILAGVIITAAVADGGIIDRAEEAMKGKERAEAEELVIASYVYKTTASTTTVGTLDLNATADAIYENLTTNGFTLMDGNTQAGAGSDILEGDKINLNIVGKHGNYSGTVTDKGLEKNLEIEGEPIIPENTIPSVPPEEPEEEIPYSFTLNDLGEWKIGSDGWISFDKSTVWEKIGKDLYEDDNYKLNSGQSGNWLFIVESTNEDIANGVKVILQDENELKKNFAITGHILDDNTNEFFFQVTNTSFEEILTEEEKENGITYQKFMNDYGNTTFYFITIEEAGVNF